MNNLKLKNRIYDINAQRIFLPNGKVGEPYQAKIDREKWNLTDLSYATFEPVEEIGLFFDKETDCIQGTPIQSGDFKIKFLFRVTGEPENIPPHEKQVSILINPDPKTLWKCKKSDRNALFWKRDNKMAYAILGKKSLLAASKRGRSHQNDGAFRDDDFAYAHIERNGWSVVAVADGAGGYPLTREGSRIACNTVIACFRQGDDLNLDKEFESMLQSYIKSKNTTQLKQAENLSKQILYKAVLAVFNQIKAVAMETQTENPGLFNHPKAKNVSDYFHTTLVFAVFKEYEDIGWIILTFGVGDCPVAVINREMTQTKLLNRLDVGDFGGGTRVVTQTGIFHSTEHPMAARFNFHIMKDFSYLFLMTDGIYDPKFEVETNLENHEKWKGFLADLRGKNEDEINIFEPPIVNLFSTRRLLRWMDFWATGNHDDRTLAIIY